MAAIPRPALALAFVPLLGCATHSALPKEVGPPPAPASSVVMTGFAHAYRFSKGSWVAAPGYDYDYTVLERRYPDHWDVVKEIHRRNPHYDGLAGPRDQTLAFTVHTKPASRGGEDLTVESTLGTGSGHVDAGERDFRMEMEYPKKGLKGLFIPFDHVRISQRRPRAEGQVAETVELFSRKKGVEKPFMKMEEEGVVYRPERGRKE